MDNTELFEVDDFVLEEVLKFFEKNKKSAEEDIENLKTWLKLQSHLPETMSAKMIENFLIMNKFDIDKTKQKLEVYYTVRLQLFDIFQNINPKLPNMKIASDAMYFVALPKLTEEMYRVFVFQVRDKSIMENLKPRDMIRLMINLVEIRLHEDVAFGDIAIFDVKNFSLKFLMKITPATIYTMVVTLYEKLLSCRLKAAYVINAPIFSETFMKIVKAVMKTKLFRRIHLCRNSSILLEKIDKNILPLDYGGLEKSLEELQIICSKKLVEYQERFDQLDEFLTDERFKPKK